jgi:hypothetical protein
MVPYAMRGGGDMGIGSGWVVGGRGADTPRHFYRINHIIHQEEPTCSVSMILYVLSVSSKPTYSTLIRKTSEKHNDLFKANVHIHNYCAFPVSPSSPSAIIYVSSLRILYTYLPTSIFEYYIVLQNTFLRTVCSSQGVVSCAIVRILVTKQSSFTVSQEHITLVCISFYPYLKVLSSEMDLAKSGFIRKVLIKGRGAEIFRKFCQPPIL